MQFNEKNATIQRSNKHADAFKKSERQINIDGYKKELEQKPYYDTARIEYFASIIGSYISNLVSILTAATFLYYRFLSVFPDWLPNIIGVACSGVLSLSLLIMLEAIKRVNTGAFWRSVYLERATETRRVLVLVILSIISVSFSILGAVEFSEKAANEGATIAATMDNEIQSVTDSTRRKIEALETAVRELETRTNRQIKQGRLLSIPETVQDNIDGKNRKIDILKAEAEKEGATIAAKFESMQDSNLKNHTEVMYFVLALTGGAEVITILGIWFMVFYRYRCASESLNASHVRIVYDNATKEKETPRTSVTRNVHACTHCGNKYEKKVKHQKYCSDSCRITAYEDRTGNDLKRFKEK